MGKGGELKKLMPLLEASYRVEQMKMRKIMDRVADLSRQLAQLERPLKTPDQDLSPAVIAGSDLKWERWAQDRKVLINQELALAFQDRERVKTSLKHALSKREAAKAMAKSVDQKEAQLLSRRSSW